MKAAILFGEMEFVNTKLELYKKLSEPQVNAYIKQKWFDKYHQARV